MLITAADTEKVAKSEFRCSCNLAVDQIREIIELE